MIDSKIVNILKKVYHYTNSDYEKDYFGKTGFKTGFLVKEQRLLLEKANLLPNNFEKWTHESLLDGLLKIKRSEKITLDFCTSLFIKGLSGDFPRYRQTLMSFCYLSKIDHHRFERSESTTSCAICGLPEYIVQDRTHSLFTFHMGHSWNEMPENFLAELQEVSEISKPEVLAADIERFVNLFGKA